MFRSTFARVVASTAIYLALVVAAQAGLDVLVDKSNQRMFVTVDGVTRYVWNVSTGADGYATPSGNFRPFRLEREHYSQEWDDAPMPHSIFFTDRGHAIHGSEHTGSLGRPASHGCVRLAPGNAALLFALVEEHGLGNTSVTVSGGFAETAPRAVVDAIGLY